MAAAQPSPAEPDMSKKLALSKEYNALTHRWEISEDTARRQLKLAWDGCETDICRKKLDEIIATSIANASPTAENAEATLLANR